MDLHQELQELIEKAEQDGDMRSFCYLELFDIISDQHTKIDLIKELIDYYENNKFVQAQPPYANALVMAIKDIINGNRNVLEKERNENDDEVMKYVPNNKSSK